MKDTLRFLTCGSVDDGKSTLIGRLLYDSKMIYQDQLNILKRESKRYGTTGEDIDFALLVDGLQSEREQGITIDVAYRFFYTKNRKYIIADTPGHEQYTRNMVTGASNSDVAVILIDARKGLLKQTRRHSYIVSLLGIEHVIVAINKMDLVGFSKEVFEDIKRAYEEIANELNIKNRYYIPISALKGDNIVNRSSNTLWYMGKSLLELLDTIDISRDSTPEPLRFPIQFVNRPNSDFRGYCGTIASGFLKVGDEITILPSGKSTKVASIIDSTSLKESKELSTISYAKAGMAITITTEDEVDISRGDMVVDSNNIPRVSNNLKVMIVWMDETPLEVGKEYDIKRATTMLSGYVERINYRVDIDSYKKEVVDSLNLNDIASCRLKLSRPIIADRYRDNRYTGSFIIIDKITNNTVGAGMIVDVARREQERVNTNREYTEAERELNAYIRKHYPEWNCKAI